MTVPLCLQFILLICWTFCGLYVFCCGAFALDRLLIIIVIIIISSPAAVKDLSAFDEDGGNIWVSVSVSHQLYFGISATQV